MSAINTNAINTNYPVPGVNNSSQGFRDNFTSIKNNLNIAGTEISDLQNKEKSLKQLLIDNGAGVIDGTLHRCVISLQDGRTVVDWQSIAARFEPSRQLITAHTSTGEPFYSVRMSAKKTRSYLVRKKSQNVI